MKTQSKANGKAFNTIVVYLYEEIDHALKQYYPSQTEGGFGLTSYLTLRYHLFGP